MDMVQASCGQWGKEKARRNGENSWVTVRRGAFFKLDPWIRMSLSESSSGLLSPRSVEEGYRTYLRVAATRMTDHVLCFHHNLFNVGRLSFDDCDEFLSGAFPHLIRRLANCGQGRRHQRCTNVIGKSNHRNIFRNSQPVLLNCPDCAERGRIVDSNNSPWPS